MSVQGTILVLDGVSTNRIMLKVQLTAAWYHVVQGEKLSGLMPLLRRSRPDLVLVALTLPDGTAADVKRQMMSDPALADVPVVAIAPQNDKSARLRALSDGLDDVLTHPFKDTLLLARVRSLLRLRAERQDLKVKDGPHSIGFAEPAAALIEQPKQARVAIMTHAMRTGTKWRQALSQKTNHAFTCHALPNLSGVLSGPTPDAIIVELGSDLSGRNILADLRSRGATRHTVLIGVLPDDNATLAAEALDRGADAICLGGLDTEEISLRLNTQISRKSRDDRLRASVRKGLTEALTDPLTGLFNRRYAMRALEQVGDQSRQSGREFAVMLADLDHFKTINDQFGHSGGDMVLIETARRLQDAVTGAGFVARVGGEEFMIVLPDSSQKSAERQAEIICESICRLPFRLPDHPQPIPVTISVGMRLCSAADLNRANSQAPVDHLIKSADTALYAAKKAGRNQVQIQRSAA